MPKKSKKSTEGESTPALKAALSVKPVETVPVNAEPEADSPKPKRKAAAKKSAASKLPTKKTAVRKKAAKSELETPAEAEIRTAPEAAAALAAADVEAEVAGQAAMVADDATEANGPSEVLTPMPEAEAPETAAAESAEEPDEFPPEPRPPAKMERLQKILAQAGIASRRHAEELISEGRVQVNGQVVTQLGSKADPARDHIRVDGKLLHGAERLRYFMLNKPRGYVTTVSDPEGRPTVMEFFKKAGERLYPVGRLDYLSEGLLLVTNDGELANKLTRAASGVEKTYLVKVSGQPTEDEIEILREGVRIDRGAPGEGRVQTAPARIRQVRIGENPWYEVVLIEGRNRELRKMFEEIGHFVEKIRRVGYGPLVLDLEPGQMRELDAEELNKLRLAADGKWKPRKIKTSAMLPREAGRTVDLEAGKKGGKRFGTGRPGGLERARRDDREERRPQRGSGEGQDRPRGGSGQGRSGYQDRGFPPRRDQGRREGGGGLVPRGPQDRGQDRGGDRRIEGRGFGQGQRREGGRGFARPADRGDQGGGFEQRRPAQGGRRSFDRPAGNRGGFSRPQGRAEGRTDQGRGGQRPFRGRPEQGSRPPQGERPLQGETRRFQRPGAGSRSPRREQGAEFEERPFRPRPERPGGAAGERPRFGGKPSGSPATGPRRWGDKPGGGGRGFGGGQGRAGQGSSGFGGNRRSGGQGGFGRSSERSGSEPRGTGSGRTERTGFQGRGQGGSRSGSGPRQGTNGARPAFKGKSGSRGPNRGPGRGKRG